MTEENQKILNDNRKFYISISGPSQTMMGFNAREKDDLLRVAREDFFGPGYSPDLYCGPCISEFIIRLYRAYDEWLSKQPVIVHANFPKHD